MIAPMPVNDDARIAWLRQSRILDTSPEPGFDDITKLAAQVYGVPVAGISLIAEERQWFKSIFGSDVREIPRHVAFCAHTILRADPLIIPDTAEDERFAENPLVKGDLEIRFYAGAPLLTSDGHNIGSLCIMDRKPRQLQTEETTLLELLARQVVGRIEMKRQIALQESLMAERAVAQEALQRSEEELRAVVDQAMEGIFLFDPVTMRLIKTNTSLRSMLGYSETEAASLQLYDIIAHSKESVDQQIKELLQSKERWFVERQYLRKDGTIIVVEVNARVVYYGGDCVCSVVVHDLTRRRQAEADRQAAEDGYQSLFENASEGIFQTTPEGRYRRANPALARIYGYDSPEQMISELTDLGRQLYILPERRQAFQLLMQQDGGVIGFESEVVRRDGTRIWISESARSVMDDAGSLCWYEGFVEDITERRNVDAIRERALRDAQEKADRDPLTGLLNHRAFQHRLEQEAQRARDEGTTMAVVMLDVDGFEFFNDVYGHVIGDCVLAMVAQRLQKICRSCDTVSRFGGDEFALLLPNVSRATAADIELRMRADLSSIIYENPEQGLRVPITVSVGASLLTCTGMERHEALRLADERLRRAKTGGGIDNEADHVRLSMNGVEGFTMLDALVTAVDNKDRYTRRHSEDVMIYSLMIADSLELDAKTRRTVAIAALLHDVGKIGVPDNILRKPGKLTHEEYEVVKQHPQMGEAIVGAVPELRDTLEAVKHHHERWDGHGYPSRLCAEEIPLIARLMAVADAYSAMTTDRPYREGMQRDTALSILEAGAGTQWDPRCVALFAASMRPERRLSLAA